MKEPPTATTDLPSRHGARWTRPMPQPPPPPRAQLPPITLPAVTLVKMPVEMLPAFRMEPSTCSSPNEPRLTSLPAQSRLPWMVRIV
eukprot:1259994-Prymnesium_polylepis.1